MAKYYMRYRLYENEEARQELYYINEVMNHKLTVDENNFIHSINDEPSWVEIIDYNSKIKKCWYYHGVLSRDNDKPAVIVYLKNGEIIEEVYFLNGLEHRENGPSNIFYDVYGEISGKFYSLNGNSIPQEQYEIYNNRNEILNKI